MTMRIAPRTLLCATIWRVGGSLDDTCFEELHELATAADDKRSLVIGLTGLVQLMQFYGKYTEASQLASRHVELLDSIGDPELTVGLLITPVIVKWAVGEVTEAMELSQRAIDASRGDPTMGNLMVGSPLALALVMRGATRCCLGVVGWREDFDDRFFLHFCPRDPAGPVGAGQKLRQQLKRSRGRGQSDATDAVATALSVPGYKFFQPLEREREIDPAFVSGERMQFIHDHEAATR
jgi:hypothetical protein